jgi:hypothetical protein
MKMSYDISYKSKSGKEYSSVNITYNYSWFYYHFLDKEKGIRWLYGKKGKDCIKRLKKAIKPFENYSVYENDYWADTPGNCVAPLKTLLSWCEDFPDGVFEGD